MPSCTPHLMPRLTLFRIQVDACFQYNSDATRTDHPNLGLSKDLDRPWIMDWPGKVRPEGSYTSAQSVLGHARRNVTFQSISLSAKKLRYPF